MQCPVLRSYRLLTERLKRAAGAADGQDGSGPVSGGDRAGGRLILFEQAQTVARSPEDRRARYRS